jgi:hypothetical protein
MLDGKSQLAGRFKVPTLGSIQALQVLTI